MNHLLLKLFSKYSYQNIVLLKLPKNKRHRRSLIFIYLLPMFIAVFSLLYTINPYPVVGICFLYFIDLQAESYNSGLFNMIDCYCLKEEMKVLAISDYTQVRLQFEKIQSEKIFNELKGVYPNVTRAEIKSELIKGIETVLPIQISLRDLFKMVTKLIPFGLPIIYSIYQSSPDKKILISLGVLLTLVIGYLFVLFQSVVKPILTSKREKYTKLLDLLYKSKLK